MRLALPAKNKLLIIYKLLADLLFLLLFFFTLTLIADGLIPGIVSSHISFLKIVILITLNLGALYFVGAAAEISLSEERPNKKTIAFLAMLALLLILNGVFKLNLYLAIFILAVTSIGGFFLERLFFRK